MSTPGSTPSRPTNPRPPVNSAGRPSSNNSSPVTMSRVNSSGPSPQSGPTLRPSAAQPPTRAQSNSIPNQGPRMGPPQSRPSSAGRSTPPNRSSSEDDLKYTAGRLASVSISQSMNQSINQQPRTGQPRPNTLNVNDMPRTNQTTGAPHSAGIPRSRNQLNRTNSGTALNNLATISSRQSSPSSGSATSYYASMSTGIDASPIVSSSYSMTTSPSISSNGIGGSSTVTSYSMLEGGDEIPDEVECFENQRYYPLAGFCSRMLPTDRPPWSNDEGTQSRQFTDFKCPPGWAWVNEWRIFVDPKCETTDMDGWVYGTEFTKEFKGDPVRTVKHFVRRRRWVRRRVASRSNPLARLQPGSTVGGPLSRAPSQPQLNNSLTVQTRQQTVSSTVSVRPPPPQPALVTLSSLYAAPMQSPVSAPRRSAFEKVVEHQRFYPIKGWSSSLLPTDPVPSLSDAKGKPIESKESIKPNKRKRASLSNQSNNQTIEIEGEWQWVGEWTVDSKSYTDRDGWTYSIDFHNARWTGVKGIEHFARKRTWIREKCLVVDEAKMRKKQTAKVLELIENWRKEIALEEADPLRVPVLAR